MEITMEELVSRRLGGGVWRMIDTRSEYDVSHSPIDRADILSEAEVLDWAENGRFVRTDNLVIVCARGELSIPLAEKLEEMGYKAYSLTGGYYAWRRYQLQQEEIDNSPEALKAYNQKVEESIQKKFHSQLMSPFCKAIKQYQLIQPGDKIAVCISGGKDSMLMAKMFSMLHRYTKIPFDVEYLVMDPGYAPENRALIEENARRLQIPVTIRQSDIFDAVFTIEKSPCYLCARMRRGHLYAYAKEMGCNKIAIGHHYDDVIETILMGMLYGAQIQTMMPKLHSQNFEGMELIRPLYLIREDDIKRWRDYNHLRFLQCACKFTDTCSVGGNHETNSKRVEVKKLIQELKKTNPDVEGHIFKSVENVKLDTVIGYKQDGIVHSFLDDYDLKKGPDN